MPCRGNNCFHPTRVGQTFEAQQLPNSTCKSGATCLLVNGYLCLDVLRKDGMSFQLNHLGKNHQNPTEILRLPFISKICKRMTVKAMIYLLLTEVSKILCQYLMCQTAIHRAKNCAWFKTSTQIFVLKKRFFSAAD